MLLTSVYVLPLFCTQYSASAALEFGSVNRSERCAARPMRSDWNSEIGQP